MRHLRESLIVVAIAATIGGAMVAGAVRAADGMAARGVTMTITTVPADH